MESCFLLSELLVLSHNPQSGNLNTDTFVQIGLLAISDFNSAPSLDYYWHFFSVIPAERERENVYKQIFAWARWCAALIPAPETREKRVCFQGVFLGLKKKREIVIWEVQLCSSVAPGGMLPISGCLWEAGDSPGFIWFLCESEGNESILTITHWAFHFIQICSAALKLVSGCAREKQKNKNTYYKRRLKACTAPSKFRSLHLVKSYVLKPPIPLSSSLLNI